MRKVSTLDTTLRDGAQGEGISFTVRDKISIIKLLDDFGVDYIEAGNPASNPKDMELFSALMTLKLKKAKICSFGSTRRKYTLPEEDAGLQLLKNTNTPVVVLFGKSWDLHVTDVLCCSLEENLHMIKESIEFFKKDGKEVIFDAEHFFDGYRNNREYAIDCLKAAVKGGADKLVLCDTNGSAFPGAISDTVKEITGVFNNRIEIGIHCHNDCGLATAGTIAAVEAGASHIQGTFVGIGERCGNASLAVSVANLQLKLGYDCVPAESMQKLTHTARAIADIANISLPNGEPFIGSSAFAHKAGMHADGVSKNSITFEHINPSLVGNNRRFLLSEYAGRNMLLSKIKTIKPDADKDSPFIISLFERLKNREHLGYQYESADASFELLARKEMGLFKPHFELLYFKSIVENFEDGDLSSMALIKIRVGDREEVTAAEGNGPINALDNALRKALCVFYPQISKVRLEDYKVRVIDSSEATAAKVRVLITSTDGSDIWTTVGVSSDIIEASWEALVDSLEYRLIDIPT